MMNHLSDEKLFTLCKKYGTQTKMWRQKFIGLLPEIFRRKLNAKKGFSSIFEFAAKLGGLSAEQVRLTLNLEKRFEDKPILKGLLVNGEVDIHKLARVVAIATAENEAALAEQVKLLPKSALEVLIKDEKISAHLEEVNQKGNGLLKRKVEGESLPGQTLNSAERKILNFELSENLIEELNKLQSQGHDVNGLLLKMLEQRKEQIEKNKDEIAKCIEPSASRYIPVKIRKILSEEFGTKCSIITCEKTAVTIHHTQRFSMCQNHDPKYLAPLCKEHHSIAHSIDQKYQAYRSAAMYSG